MTNENWTAFPSRINDADYTRGIDTRTYIAAKALQGLLANSTGDGYPEDYAKAAVDNADALIKELNR